MISEDRMDKIVYGIIYFLIICLWMFVWMSAIASNRSGEENKANVIHDNILIVDEV